MITLYKLAREIGVAYNTVYKRLKNSEWKELMEKDENGRLSINAEVEGIVRSWYNTPSIDKSIDKSIDFDSKINVHLRAENAELKTELFKAIEHSRKQAEELTNLAKQLAEISKNNQVLLGIEQNKSAPKMIEAESKKSFWNIFKKKK